MFKDIPLFIKQYVLILLIYSVLLTVSTSFSKQDSFAQEDNKSGGMKLFKTNCSGCHLNGKNLIKPEKPIIGSKKLTDKKTFKNFIESPPKPMPKFKNISENEEQLQALYKYVTSLKDK